MEAKYQPTTGIHPKVSNQSSRVVSAKLTPKGEESVKIHGLELVQNESKLIGMDISNLDLSGMDLSD